MGSWDFDSLVKAARDELARPKQSRMIGDDTSDPPRFELYHAGLSICSEKVRTTLAEKGVPYLSHDLSLGCGKHPNSDKFMISESYRPHYVRLRLFAAGPELRQRMALEHSMRTSVETEGFDACVVPLLIDHDKRDAIVDSAQILEYIEGETPEHRLIPEDPALATAVREQVAINDRIPHPGMLYGFHPNDPRPEFWKRTMDGVYDVKRQALEMLIDAHGDDEELLQAWRDKITKEMAGKKIQKDPEYMAGILKEFEQIIVALDTQLGSHDGPWGCGTEFTLADCVWGAALYRILYVGHAYIWDGYPRIEEYAQRMYERPSLRSAVIEWPKPFPPSQHTVGVDSPRGA